MASHRRAELNCPEPCRRERAQRVEGHGGLARRSAERTCVHEGGSNSVVESQPSKLLVAGSIPVSRSSLRSRELTPKRELRLGQPGEGGHAVARRSRTKADVATESCWNDGRLVGRSRESAQERAAKADVAQ